MPLAKRQDHVHFLLTPPGWKWHASDPHSRLGLPALLQQYFEGCDPKCDMFTETSFEDIAVWKELYPQPAAAVTEELDPQPAAAADAAPERSYPTLLGRTRSMELAKPARALSKRDIGIQVCSDDLPGQGAGLPPRRPALPGPQAGRTGCSPERPWVPPTGSAQLTWAGQAGLDVLEVLQLQGGGGAEAEWQVAERVPPLLLPGAGEAQQLLDAARARVDAEEAFGGSLSTGRTQEAGGRVDAEQDAKEEDTAGASLVSRDGGAAKRALLKGLRSGRVAQIVDAAEAAEAAEGLAATARGGCSLPPVPPSGRSVAAPAAAAHAEWELAMEWHSLEHALKHSGAAGTTSSDKVGQ